jgi:hypothetical protein
LPTSCPPPSAPHRSRNRSFISLANDRPAASL